MNRVILFLKLLGLLTLNLVEPIWHTKELPHQDEVHVEPELELLLHVKKIAIESE